MNNVITKEEYVAAHFVRSAIHFKHDGLWSGDISTNDAESFLKAYCLDTDFCLQTSFETFGLVKPYFTKEMLDKYLPLVV